MSLHLGPLHPNLRLQLKMLPPNNCFCSTNTWLRFAIDWVTLSRSLCIFASNFSHSRLCPTNSRFIIFSRPDVGYLPSRFHKYPILQPFTSALLSWKLSLPGDCVACFSIIYKKIRAEVSGQRWLWTPARTPITSQARHDGSRQTFLFGK